MFNKGSATLAVIALLGLVGLVWVSSDNNAGVGGFSDPFISLQVGTGPVSGDILTTDGTDSDWVTPASLGLTGGGGNSFFEIGGDGIGRPTSTPRSIAIDNGATIYATSTRTDYASTTVETITGGNLYITGLDCSGFGNGGVITTDNATGLLVCEDDDTGGAGGNVNNLIYQSVAGLRYYTASSTASDNLSYRFNNGFVSNASSSVTLLNVNAQLHASSTVLVDGLTTLKGGLTLETGDTFTFNGDAFTDLTGTGLTISGGALIPNLTGGTGITFSNPTVSFDCSEVEGVGINCSGENITLDATGDWTGTLDGIEGASFLRSDANDTATGLLTLTGGFTTPQSTSTTGFIGELLTNTFKAGQAATTSIDANGDLTVGGGDITLASSLIFSGGDTTSLNLIDAIDATTETTLEAAIDALSNLTTTGTLTSGATGAGFTVNLDASTLTCTSCIDISDNTNLAVSSPITLTDDTIGLDQTANYTWTGLHTFVNSTSTQSHFAGLLHGNTLNIGTTATVTVSATGIDLPANTNLSFAGTNILADSGGTLTLSNIDALDATTENTIEAAIDTLANLTSASSLATVGTLTGGATGAGFTVNLDASTLTCTNCIDDTDIDWGTGANQVSIADLSGNQVSGALVWDFGGATSFEIVNGTAPTIDALGEIAWDTTDGTLIAFDSRLGSSVTLAQATSTYYATVEFDGDWDDEARPIWQAPPDQAITLREIRVTSMGSSTPTVAFNLQERAYGSLASWGSDILSTSTADGDGLLTRTFTDASIAANAHIVLTTGVGAESGFTDYLTFQIVYTKNVE